MVAVAEHRIGHLPSKPVVFENGVVQGAKRAMQGQRRPKAMVAQDVPAASVMVETRAVADVPETIKNRLKITADVDPARQLDEVREALIGPTRDLQEARLEEMVVILEEQETAAKATHANVQAQFRQMKKADEQLGQLLLTTNQMVADYQSAFESNFNTVKKRLDELSATIASDMQRAEQQHAAELNHQAVAFDAKLEKLSHAVTKQFEDLAIYHKDSLHNMASDLTASLRSVAAELNLADDRIAEQMNAGFAQIEANANHQWNTLNAKTAQMTAEMHDVVAELKADDRRVVELMHTRMEQAAVQSDDEKRRNIKVLSDGLTSLADRLQSI